MITVYTYTGKPGVVPAGYIPCLIGTDDNGNDVYFETTGEIEASQIKQTKQTVWINHPVRIVAIRFDDGEVSKLGYALADELLTAGVDF